MSLDKATVAKIARLARIEVGEADLERLAAELSGILDFVEQLDEVDTADVAPLTSVVEMRLKAREDEVSDGDRQDDILRNAPRAVHGFFVVPKVVE
jgi:aspartyl-tRNA(Asn)/glutamyl-tRNA(Gln) amidotransferase subunit C